MTMLSAASGFAIYGLGAAAAIGWQVWEYRSIWPHSGKAWWLVKLSVPLLGFGILLLAMAAFPSSGMEALAGFYLGLLLAIIGVPLLIFGLARFGQLKASACGTAAASLIGSAVLLWFCGHGLANQLSYTQSWVQAQTPEAKANQALRDAANNPRPVGGEVALVGEAGYLLADGSVLVHLEFDVDAQLQVFAIDVANEVAPDRFQTLTTTCVDGDRLHAFVTGRSGLGYDVRSRWHRGTPETMVVSQTSHRIPDPDRETLGRYIVHARGAHADFPTPVRRLQLEVRKRDGRYLTESDVADPSAVARLGMHARNSCLTTTLVADEAIDAVALPVVDVTGGSRRALPVWLDRPNG